MIRLAAAILFGILLALAGLELYHARYAEPAYCPVPTPTAASAP